MAILGGRGGEKQEGVKEVGPPVVLIQHPEICLHRVGVP